MKYNQGRWMKYYYGYSYSYYYNSGIQDKPRIGVPDDYYSGAEDGVVRLLYVPCMYVTLSPESTSWNFLTARNSKPCNDAGDTAEVMPHPDPLQTGHLAADLSVLGLSVHYTVGIMRINPFLISQ